MDIAILETLLYAWMPPHHANYHEDVVFILRDSMHIKYFCREQMDSLSYVHIRHMDSFISYRWHPH
jgi:hypothetical protein